jgi:enoyl-CoA hydratase/carnithine racemase
MSAETPSSPSSPATELTEELTGAVSREAGSSVFERSGLRLSRAGAVVHVALARPEKRNAQRPETWLSLAALGRVLQPDVRAVVVRGDGPSFSAGIDLSVVAEQAGGALPDEATIASYQDGFTWLARPEIVSIALVQGHAVGAGFQLALACDLRIVADDVQFRMAETSLGLVPDLTGTETLVHLVGYGRALEICLTGRRVGAQEASALGLATTVVGVDELDATAEDLLAALLAPLPGATAATKALLLRTREHPGARADQLAAEREAQVARLQELAAMAAAASRAGGA